MIEAEQKISVKERTQRFNRLASVEGQSPSPPKTQQCIATGSPYRKRFEKVNIDVELICGGGETDVGLEHRKTILLVVLVSQQITLPQFKRCIIGVIS